MKYLNPYNTFLNEAWFPGKKRLLKQKEELEKQKEELNKQHKDINKQKADVDKQYEEALSKLNQELQQHLEPFLNKKFKFQYEQIVWKSNSSNFREIDIADFTFNGLEPDLRTDWNTNKITDLFLTLHLTDRYNKVVEVWFDEKSPTEKLLDLEYCKPWDKNFSTILHGNYQDKQEIDYKNPDSFPHKADYMDLVPAEYNTYNLLKELKFFVEQANEHIREQQKSRGI